MGAEVGVAPRRADVLRVLAEHRHELARDYLVRSLSLFGSVGRDAAEPDSDVDVLVDFAPKASLLTLSGLQRYLEELLGREVDVISRRAIRRQIRDRILGEQLPVLAETPDGQLSVVPHDETTLSAGIGRGCEVSMPPRNWTMRVEDMLDAAAKIARFTEGKEFDAFEADDLVVDATLRNIEIIGEAARHIPEEIRARYPSVPWQRMAHMRNLVIHAYPDVDLGIVWQVVRQHVPALVPHLRDILASEPTQ